MVDATMKVTGIKVKQEDGKITHSQYLTVKLVDSEHPFFSRVWHGMHKLDATSPLLTNIARQKITENGGSWPRHWLDPDIIRKKIDVDSLVSSRLCGMKSSIN